MLNKLRQKIKTKAEQKIATVVIDHIKTEVMNSNSSWKTSLAGIIAGAVPIVSALIDAYNSGQFTGKTGGSLLLGLAFIAMGALAKDKDKTGLPTDDTKKN